MHSALRHPNFRRFWMGHGVSLIGTWMQSVGQGWLVLELTNSPFRLGLVSALQFTPVLLLSLVAGAIVDRLPRRRVLLVTQTTLMAAAFLLGVLTLTGLVRYWHVLVLAVVFGLANAFDVPARQSMIAELVPREDLMNAIALNSAAFNTARVVGPAAAGLLVGSLGTAAAFLCNGVSFLAVIAALLTLQVPPRVRPEPNRNLVGEIRAGLGYIRRTPIVLVTIALTGLISIFSLNFNVFVPTLARTVLGQEATGYGFLMSAVGLGAVAAALSLAARSKQGPTLRLAITGAVSLGAMELLLGATSFYPPEMRYYLAAGLLIATGFSMITFSATAQSLVQSTVPDELRGRVMSAYQLVFGGFTPFGAMFAGTFSDLFGVTVALAPQAPARQAPAPRAPRRAKGGSPCCLAPPCMRRSIRSRCKSVRS